MSWPSMAVTISIPWFCCYFCSSLHTRTYKARGRVLRVPVLLARPLASCCLACTTPPSCTATAAPRRRSPEPRQPSPCLGEQLDQDDGALSSSTPSYTSLYRKHRRAERHPFCVHHEHHGMKLELHCCSSSTSRPRFSICVAYKARG
jgi:hypothetical protein